MQSFDLSKILSGRISCSAARIYIIKELIIMIIFDCLYSVIYSGFWDTGNIKDWASELIGQNEKFPWWLAELALAENSADMLDILRNTNSGHGFFDLRTYCSIHGYYSLMYKEKRIDRTEYIRLCVDIHNSYFDEDSNVFYDLLDCNDNAFIDSELERLCGEYRAVAERQYKYIRDFRLSEKGGTGDE